MVTMVRLVGTSPLFQFAPTVQSLLVLPCHVWAEASLADRAVSAVADRLARAKRHNRVLLQPGSDRPTGLGLFWRKSFGSRRIVASTMHLGTASAPVSFRFTRADG
jgi:hypothetical protein